MLTTLLRVGLTRSLAAFHFTDQSVGGPALPDLEAPGLYVHIPFCRSLCSFCPYCKEPYDESRARRYRESLLEEIRLTAGDLPEKPTASSLYFGGGTPALMVDDLPAIIDTLKEYFTIAGGIGVELHPLDCSEKTLSKLKRAGVTMVSLGIQSFDRGCLEKLGRRWEPFAEVIRRVRDHGFSVIDVDLIFAIPGQTAATLQSDVGTAFASGATQVSTYPFIDFTFSDNRYKPLSDKVKQSMLRELVRFCQDEGLERTSVWTFAKPGTAKYSSVTRTAFVGFGLSAASLLRSQFRINTFSLDGYCQRISQGRLPTALTLNFTPHQRAAYFLFWSVYGLTIDAQEFKALTGVSLRRMYGPELILARLLGILAPNGENWRLTDKGAALYHDVEQAYTGAYIDKMWNVCRLEAFPRSFTLK